MTLTLVALAACAVFSSGPGLILPAVTAAVLAAAMVDAPILRARRRWWAYPDGAVLTGLFVAMILSAHEPWYVIASTSALAVISKYLIRGRTANIFNPAALAVVVTFYLFGTGQDWWGALAVADAAGLVILIVAGAVVTNRVNRGPLVLSFLGAYFLAFTVAAFAGQAGFVAEIFRAPDVNAALFFAFFILTDPPTSPVARRDQIVCGVIVAAAAFTIFEFVGAAHYLLSGVLVGNLWEARRRRLADGRRAAARHLTGHTAAAPTT